MHCPFCFAVDTKVIDSRLVGEALLCVVVGSARFVTNVSPRSRWQSWVMPRVVKNNDVREPFNEDKLRSGDAESAGKTAGQR